MIIEQLEWEGRPLTVTWQDETVRPLPKLITQASGICFTDAGLVVLVRGLSGRYALPGGHIEAGETLEAAFKREVQEEACATMQHLRYLGAQRVDDPKNKQGPTRYYQARFWARVELEAFVPQHETTQRQLVPPGEVIATLNWPTTHIAEIVLAAACQQEQRFRKYHQR